MPLGFSKACRTCLTLDGTLISIYDSDGYNGQGRITDMIEEITTITPMKTDGLPELVCQTCFNEINRCYSFKVKCLNSDSTLRKLFAADEETEQQQVRTEEFYKNQRLPVIDSLILLKRAVEQPTMTIKTEQMSNDDSYSYYVITPVGEENETEDQTNDVELNDRIINVKTEVEDAYDYDEDNISQPKLFTSIKKDEVSNMHDDSPEPIYLKVKTELFDEEPSDESTQFEIPLNENQLNQTQKHSPSSGPYPCPKCSKVFLYISRLKEHLTAHSNQRPYKCSMCDKSFKQNGHLKSHININHNKEARFECKKCKKLFTCNSNLQGHMKTHNKIMLRRNAFAIQRYKIEDSTEELSGSNIYESEDRKHGGEEKKYLGKQEALNDSVAAVNAHVDIEAKVETTMNESLLNISPTRRSYRVLKDEYHSSPESTGIKKQTRSSDRFTPTPVEDHTQNETNESKGPEAARQYNCTHCFKEFKYVSRLNEHLRSHSSERPFDCHICGKNFKQINHVMTHIKLSHKKKPFKCPKCIRTFASKSLLKKHLKTHNLMKEKSFIPKPSFHKKETLTVPQQFEEEHLFDNDQTTDDEHPFDDGKPFDDGESLNEEQLMNMEKQSLSENQTDNSTVGQLEKQQINPDEKKEEKKIEIQQENTPIQNIPEASDPDHTIVCTSSSRRSNRAKKEVTYCCDAEDNPTTSKVSLQMAKNETDKKDDEIANNFKCPICHRDFYFVSRLTAHMRSHSEERPFPCSLCDKSFKLNGNLQSHIMICHKKLRPYNCSDCSRTFSCTSNLRKHLKIHNKTLGRRKPKRRVNKKKNLNKKQPIQDTYLDEQLEQVEDINNMEISTQEPNEITEKEFEGFQENISEQNVTEDNVEAVKCQLCAMSVFPENLTKHMQQAHNLPASTRVVLKIDPSNQSLSDTETEQPNTIVDILNNIYKCTICDKFFPFNSRLKEHMRAHSNDRPFECSLCDKSFKQKCHLKSHVLISHRKIKPFKCTMCFRPFSCSSNLKQHMKTHFGNSRRRHRRFPKIEESADSQERLSDLNAELKNLSMTQEESQSKENLEVEVEEAVEVEVEVEIHENVTPEHLPEVEDPSFEAPLISPSTSPYAKTSQPNLPMSDMNHPIQCLQCNKVFPYVSLLSKHLRTHSDERPFACTSCEKTFKQSSHLKSHIMIRHKKLKPYKCQECFRTFSCNSNLTKHMKTHNGKTTRRKTKLKRSTNKKNINPITEIDAYSEDQIRFEDKSKTEQELEVNTNIDFNKSLQIEDAVGLNRIPVSHYSESSKNESGFGKEKKGESWPQPEENQIEQSVANTATPPFQCRQCNKEFTFISRLNEHLRTHSDERPFICSICGKSFKQNGHLKTHIMISHDKIKPYKCDDCPRDFSSNFNLQVHVKTHLPKGRPRKARRNNILQDQPLSFDKNLTPKSNIKKQILKKLPFDETSQSGNNSQGNIHQELSFENGDEQVSGSSLFSTPGHLQQNQSTPQSNKSAHTNVLTTPKEVDKSLSNSTNPLQCHLCSKVFTYSSALGKHLRTHSDDRPYVCTLCGKTFKQSGHLKSHVMISHDKIKPYKCDKCFRDFSSNYNRKVHKCKFATTGKSYRRKANKSNVRAIKPKIDDLEQLHPINDGNENTIEKKKATQKSSMDGGSSSSPKRKVQQKRNRCSVCYIPVELENLTKHMQEFHSSLDSTSAIVKQEPLDEPPHISHPLFQTFSNQIDTGDGTQPLNCHVCNKEFLYVSRLNEHLRSHSDERPFICTICDKSFKQKGHLKNHIMINHKKILPYKCNECLRSFPSRYNLKIHQKTHRNKANSKRRAAIKRSYYKDPPYHAKTGTSPEPDQLLADENIEEHTEILSAQDIIDKSIGNVETVDEDQIPLELGKDDAGGNIMDPELLSLPQSSGVQVKKEPTEVLPDTNMTLLSTNNTEKQTPFICLVCGKTFTRQGQLRTHIMMHHSNRVKPFKCKECPRAFSSKFNLRVHHQNHHLKDSSVLSEIVKTVTVAPPQDANIECTEEKQQCLFCPKELKSLTHLKEHMKIHTSDQPFICHLCGKGFDNDTELSTHAMMSHNKSEPFKCNICAKTYRTRTGLKNHLETHTVYRQQVRKAMLVERKTKAFKETEESLNYSEQQRPQCKICKKEFTNNWVLKDHMKSHTNEKPFICPICEKGFNKKYNLKIHVMAHKKIKPFKCDYCPQSFCTNAGRRLHHRTHTRYSDHTVTDDTIINS